MVDQILNGVVIGSGYALVAMGLTLVYGILRVINFAHGEVYMFGAYALVILMTEFHMSYMIAVIIVVLFGLGAGPVIELIAVRPVEKESKMKTLITTLGLSVALSNLAILVFGASPRFVQVEVTEKMLTIGDISIPAHRIIAMLTASVLVYAVWAFVKYSLPGKAMRAVAENPSMAQLLGINPRAIVRETFALSTALAAASGALLSPLFVVNPFIGTLAGLKAFAVVILGGFGNIQGAILAGILLGVTESVTTGLIGSSYKDAITFSILALALLIRPRGLISEVHADNV
jgi:branched-chain amino acid transport system permease protein